jgi:hypothetical protein
MQRLFDRIELNIKAVGGLGSHGKG